MNTKRTTLTGNPPNIVLLVLDSVRQDHLSCYGYPRQTTPNIDRLAAEGVLFENAYSASCWTIPAHASIFTGLYPSQHGVDMDRGAFAPGQETLASHLKDLGYQTACISCNSFAAGKGTELNRGFDLTVDVEGGYLDGMGQFGRAVRFVQKRWRALTRRDRGTERATRLAQEYVAQQHAAPFFLFMNFMDCHLPYRLKRPERFRFIPPVERKRVSRIPLDPFAAMAGELELSAREVAGIRALYDGGLYYIDQHVGQLVERFKELGIYDQTIFLITSDHGESFGEHGLFDHQYGLYEHLLRVPLIARFPNGILAGERVDHLIQHTDLFPTLTRLACPQTDAKDPAEYTFLTEPLRDFVISEYLVPNLNAIRRRFPMADVTRYAAALRAINAQGIKLISREDGKRELFNLASDPNELLDLSESNCDKVAELETLLEEKLGPWPGSTQDASKIELEDELKERLEAMGYL